MANAPPANPGIKVTWNVAVGQARISSPNDGSGKGMILLLSVPVNTVLDNSNSPLASGLTWVNVAIAYAGVYTLDIHLNPSAPLMRGGMVVFVGGDSNTTQEEQLTTAANLFAQHCTTDGCSPVLGAVSGVSLSGGSLAVELDILYDPDIHLFRVSAKCNDSTPVSAFQSNGFTALTSPPTNGLGSATSICRAVLVSGKPRTASAQMGLINLGYNGPAVIGLGYTINVLASTISTQFKYEGADQWTNKVNTSEDYIEL